MKSEQDNRPGARGLFSHPRECSPERPQLPEIVGQIDNPVLEAIRRFSFVASIPLRLRLVCGHAALNARPDLRVSIIDTR